MLLLIRILLETSGHSTGRNDQFVHVALRNQTEMIFQELDESASLDKARSTTLFQPGDFSNCESPAVSWLTPKQDFQGE